MVATKRVLKTTLKVFAILLIVLFVAIAIFIAGFCITIDKTVYSEDQHIQRISQRIEKNYINDKTGYTDYEVYPLYNANDEFAYICLVEFAPCGFIYVPIYDAHIYNKMYLKAEEENSYRVGYWQRYRISEGEESFILEDGVRWILDSSENNYYADKNTYFETDGNGNFIKRTGSPYKEANIQNERRYILNAWLTAIPAVKRGDKYLNLISMKEFECTENAIFETEEFSFGDPINYSGSL